MIGKTIIANYGDPDMGKTASVKLVYEKLQKVGEEVANEHGEKPLRTDNGDVCAMFEINGVRVGICSQGDPKSCQKGWMDRLVAAECLIILATCRHYGATEKLIESYESHGYRIYWTSNARLFEHNTNPRVAPRGIQARFNEQWAEEMARMIEDWCYTGK